MIDYIHKPNGTARIDKPGGNASSLFLATIYPTGEVNDCDTSIFNTLLAGDSIHFLIAIFPRNAGLCLCLYWGHSSSSVNRIPSISSKQAYESSSNSGLTMLRTFSRKPCCSAVNTWSLNRSISHLAVSCILNEGARRDDRSCRMHVMSSRERRRIKLRAERADRVSYGQVQPC